MRFSRFATGKNRIDLDRVEIEAKCPHILMSFFALTLCMVFSMISHSARSGTSVMPGTAPYGIGAWGYAARARRGEPAQRPGEQSRSEFTEMYSELYGISYPNQLHHQTVILELV